MIISVGFFRALGGMKGTTTVEGLEPYGVSVRYPRELRDNLLPGYVLTWSGQSQYMGEAIQRLQLLSCSATEQARR